MDMFSEKISPGKNLLVGFQHVLAMCPGTIAVPLIMGGAMGLDARTTAFLVSANLFTSGIAILIQVFGLSKYIGSRYPIILGSSFAPLAPMIMIGNTYGLPTLFGAIMVSGVLIFLLSFFLDKILMLFPPVVVGTFVTLIGVSLAPTAIRYRQQYVWVGAESSAGIWRFNLYHPGGEVRQRNLAGHVSSAGYYWRNGSRGFPGNGGYNTNSGGKCIPAGDTLLLWCTAV